MGKSDMGMGAKLVTVLVFSSMALACSKNAKMRTTPPPVPEVSAKAEATAKPEDTIPQETKIEELKSAKLEVVEPEKFGLIVVDSTDNPRFYAFDGETRPMKEALEKIKAGGTICMARLMNTEVKKGQVIELNSFKSGLQPKTNNLYWGTVASADEMSNTVVSLTCLKMNSDVTIGDLTKAVHGIVAIKK